MTLKPMYNTISEAESAIPEISRKHGMIAMSMVLYAISVLGFSNPFDLSHSYKFVFCTEGWMICQGLSEPYTGDTMSILSSYKIKACTAPVSDAMILLTLSFHLFVKTPFTRKAAYVYMHCSSCSLCEACAVRKENGSPHLVLLFLKRRNTKGFLKLGMSCFSSPHHLKRSFWRNLII
ncbi:hypothetical protein HAX54_042838 [Datura stramonium]|uniref:Uncharacterized protein n=1 Tax=Datura stramonium TaxID=4076 RepID=A0ABS8W3Y6_DATST|nr:hypothetical protein [Datura stramonium]